MAQANIVTLPLISSGGAPFVAPDGTPSYHYQIINDAETTVSASIDASNNLVVDATAIAAGSYQVKVRATDSLGATVDQVIPVSIVNNSNYILVGSDHNCVVDTFPFASSFSVRAFGFNGALTWTVQSSIPNITITADPSDPNVGVIQFKLFQNGIFGVSIVVKDSVGNTASKSLNVKSRPSKAYRLINGQIEVDLLSVPVLGSRQFSVSVQDSSSSTVQGTFNFLVNPPISDIRIRPYTFDHFFGSTDSAQLTLPVDGDFATTKLAAHQLSSPLGMKVSVDPNTNQVVLQGPPTRFGNDRVYVNAGLTRGGSSVGSIGRVVPVTSFSGTSQDNLGTNNIIKVRPIMLGQIIGLDLFQPDFNSPHVYKPSSYTARVAKGSSLPLGVSLDQDTGLIYGPVCGNLDHQSVIEFIDSSNNVKGSFNLTWTILSPDFSLIDAMGTSKVGQNYFGGITTTSPSDLSLITVIDGIAPPGVSFSVDPVHKTNVLVTGTPTTAGYFDIWLRATNKDGKAGYLFKRFECDYGEVLAITNTQLMSAFTGQGYTQQLLGSGGVKPYTWSLGTGSPALPTGVNLDPSSGLLNGTPSDTSYDQSVIFKITDAAGTSATKALELKVTNVLTIQDTVLPAMQTGKALDVNLFASGGTGAGNYTWSLAAGSPALPTGVKFETVSGSIGYLHGTPTDTSYSQVLTFQVVDSANAKATKSLKLYINNSGMQMINIDFSGVPSPKRGCAYHGVLSATGGQAPYVWSLEPSSGNLPAGLTISGTGDITGQTTDKTSSTVSIRVVDQQGAYGSRTLTLNTVASLSASGTALPQGRIGIPLNASSGSATSCNLPLRWTWYSPSGTPSGLNLDPLTGNISGSPTSAFNAFLVFTVTDSIGDTTNYSGLLTVNSSDLAITTVSIPDASVGNTYSTTLHATGGVAPYTWSIFKQTSAPSGLSLGINSGILSCSSISPASAGVTASLTIECTDSVGSSVTKDFSLNVIQGIRLIAGPDFTNNTSSKVLGTLEFSSLNAGTPGCINLSGSSSDWVSNTNSSFIIGVAGLPSGVSASQCSLTTNSTAFPKGVLLPGTSNDPNSGTIYWWALASSQSVVPPTTGIKLTATITGPNIPTPVSDNFTVSTKQRKTFSLVDASNVVASDLGENWA
jgi:hypothetical protein